jgi:hypothetical protein
VAGLAGSVPRTGNLGRNTVRTRGINNFDVNLTKRVNITEGVRLDFRTEFFNILNHPQFTSFNGGAVTATPGSTTAVFNVRGSAACAATTTLGSCFGEFNAARDPRIVQLAAKLYF